MVFGRNWQLSDIPALLLMFAMPFLILFRENHVNFWSIEATRLLFITVQLIIILACLLLTNTSIQVDNTRLAYITIFFIVCMMLSTSRSATAWQGVMRVTEIVTSILFIITVSSYLAKNSARSHWMLRGVLFVPLLCLFIFFTYWWLLESPQHYDWVSNPPLFINIRHFGAIVTLCLPLGYGLLMHKRHQYIGILFLTLMWALIVWTGGRGPLLASLVGCFVFLALFRQYWKIVLLTMLSGLLLSQLFIVENNSMSLWRVFNVDLANQTLNQISSSRIVIYQESIATTLKQSPWIGLGADAFRYVNPPIGHSSIHHPHNVLVEIFMSFGVIGLLLFSMILLILSKQLVHIGMSARQSKNGFQLSILIALLTGFIHAQLSGVLYLPLSNMVFIMLLAMALAFDTTTPNNASSPRLTLINKSLMVNKPLIVSTMLLLSVTIIALIQHNRSTHPQPTQSNVIWNTNYPLYLNVETWLDHAVNEGDSQKIDHFLHIGKTRSDKPEHFEQLEITLQRLTPYSASQ